MIFLSYSRKDSEFVLDIAKTLREAGANIWLDQLDIEPGSSWDDTIEAALQQADTLLVFLSKTSVASQNVRDEYSFAFDENKRIVPVLLEDCSIPFRLRRLQYADFTKNRDVGIETLIETLDLNSEIASKLKGNTAFKPSTNSSSDTKKPVSPVLKYAAYAVFILISLYLLVTNTGLLNNGSTTQVTVLVHDEAGKDQLVLPNRGQVKLIYLNNSVVETINSKGEATFKQIPKSFLDDGVSVEILFIDPEGEPYRKVHPDSLYQINSDSYISLPVKLYGLGEIKGIVKDFVSGDPISDVRISVSGHEAYSNQFGEYLLEIPPDAQQKYQTIRAFKEGYELYEINDVPIQTKQELPIVMKPKQTD